jgi:serine palmitoyltransferase
VALPHTHTGRIAPLPALVKLKERYHARLILEESHSFGVLGARGRGLSEHFQIPATKIDCIAASLEGAHPHPGLVPSSAGGGQRSVVYLTDRERMWVNQPRDAMLLPSTPALTDLASLSPSGAGASVGGFAAGATGVVGYQRLMGAGYVFSAALPPYLATASTMALKVLEQEPERLQRLRDNTAYLRATLQNIPGLATRADPLSPVLPLQLSHPTGDAAADAASLASIAAAVRARGFGLCVAHASKLTGLQRPAPLAPTLRVFASAAYTKESVVRAASTPPYSDGTSCESER